jgi:hypothetical protein
MRALMWIMNMRVAYKPGATGGENKRSESVPIHGTTDILM